MDCAGFERGLAELMSEGTEGTERDRRLLDLRSHAAECASCGGSDELLQLLQLPARERDLATEPDPEYWAAFDRRLLERLGDAEPLRPASTRRWLAAVAALVVLALVGVWLVRGTGLDRTADRAVDTAGHPAGGGPLDLPEPVVRSLSQASPDELAAQLDALADWSAAWEAEPSGADPDVGWDGGGLFPDVSDLDAEARQALLAWMREQSS